MHAPSVAHVVLVIICRLLSILVMYCSALLHRFRDWFLASMAGVQRHLLRHSQPSQLMFIRGRDGIKEVLCQNGKLYNNSMHIKH